jgi:archaellum component FlaF (FlaF/FlaG flagellin family)
MGFSLSAAFVILSISIFVSIEIFSTQILPIIDDFENSNYEMMTRNNNKFVTSINITEVNVTNNVSNFDFNITIENTGKIVLDTGEINILINGNLEEFNCSDRYILPLIQSHLILRNLNYSGHVRIKAITGYGIEDYKEIIV